MGAVPDPTPSTGRGAAVVRWWRWMKEKGEAADDRMWWLFCWVLFPLLAVVAVIFSVRDIGPEVDAALGGGRHGTFVATDESCGRYPGTCGFYGTYGSDDGQLHLSRVWLGEPPSDMRIGASAEVTYTSAGSPTVVYRAHGSYQWLFSFGFLVAGTTVLTVWYRALRKRLHAWRRLRRSRRSPRRPPLNRRPHPEPRAPLTPRRRPGGAPRRRVVK